jgi:anthranilate synthase component II
MKVLLLDNFDSFVYNIYQYLGELGLDVDVVRNDAITLAGIRARKYDRIVISPGPGTPVNKRDFGICNDVIRKLGTETPILGVCLGHQGVISAFGGKIIRAKLPMHGKISVVKHNDAGIFSNVKNPIKVMRYHSLIADEKSLPECFEVTARSEDDDAIMGVQHKTLPIYGIQFHPESILTEEGRKILKNFSEI